MTKRLAIISDFHMDSNHFSAEDLEVFDQVLQDEKITDLHFAGDISNDFHGISEAFLGNLHNKYNVTYNLGNHDMLHLTENEIANSDFLIKKFESKTLLAFHGWYDYSFMENSDFDKILRFKNAVYFDRKIHRQFDDIQTTENILVKLDEILSNLTDEIIVATHFVPHKAFIIDTRYEKFARFNAYLGSQKFHELFVKYPNVKTVVFGHAHHRRNAVKLDEISYHTRPLGYIYEWQMVRDFAQIHQVNLYRAPKKIYHEIREFPDWQAYYKKNLAAEFRSALNIFDV